MNPPVNPTVFDLQIDWLFDTALIDTIEDVPNDQGGWLRLEFIRSGYDFNETTADQVTGYQIYRRVDDPAQQALVLAQPPVIDIPQEENAPRSCPDSMRNGT